MTQIFIHQAPLKAIELKDQLSHLLRELPPRTSGPMLDRLVFARRPMPTLVLTGLHSSGKSMLIKALTDGAAEVVIDADIATDRVTEYTWDGAVQLIDTPGVHAGIDLHDELAISALKAADLVLFVITPDLLDDRSAQHLRFVADGLGKRDQLMIVVNKAQTMAADPGLRQAEVQRVLGSGSVPPFVECDAKLYVTSLGELNATRAAALRESSQLDQLRGQINTFSAQRGELAMLRQPFQLIRGVAAEAEATLVEDPDEKAVLTWLSRTRRMLSQNEQTLNAALDEERATFLREARANAEGFADDLEGLDRLTESAWRNEYAVCCARATERMNSLAQRTADRIQARLDEAFRDIASEMTEIEAGPQAELIREFRDSPQPSRRGVPGFGGARGRRSSNAGTRVDHSAQMRQAQGLLKQFGDYWGAGGGVKASAGTAGHTVTKRVGNFLGKSWKPWEAVKWANNIGKALKVAGVGLQIGVAVYDVYAVERAERALEEAKVARRRALITEVLQESEAMIDEVLREVRKAVDEPFQESYRRIDDQWDEITGAQQSRDTLRGRLRAIQDDCAAISYDIGKASGEVAPASGERV